MSWHRIGCTELFCRFMCKLDTLPNSWRIIVMESKSSLIGLVNIAASSAYIVDQWKSAFYSYLSVHGEYRVVLIISVVLCLQGALYCKFVGDDLSAGVTARGTKKLLKLFTDCHFLFPRSETGWNPTEGPIVLPFCMWSNHFSAIKCFA